MSDELDLDMAHRLPGRGQLVLELGHLDQRSEADFMVTEDNRLAFDHIQSFPHWPSPLTLLEGPAKSGKSHLARIWAARADAIDAAPETIEDIATAGGRRPVLIEDADRGGFEEKALFHLINRAMREERPVLMTARAPVGEWPLVTNDVRSRVRLASRFALSSADDILLSQMFVKLFADRQVSVDPKVISYLVARMERSSEEVVALVALVDRLALSNARPVTRAIASEALALRGAHNEDS
jgi:chromosomal replication initiation ATPase DnaA